MGACVMDTREELKHLPCCNHNVLKRFTFPFVMPTDAAPISSTIHG